LNFSRLLLVLVARRKAIALALLCTVFTTLVLTLFLPKTYKATSTIVLNYKGVDPVSGFTLSAQLMPRYMATQVDILTNVAVALDVVDFLGLVDKPRFQKQFRSNHERQENVRVLIAEALLKKLAVIPARESSVLDISYKDADPKFSADVANAFAQAYQRANVKLKIDPILKTAGYFQQQVRQSLDRLEKAQNEFTLFQKQNNILTTERGIDVDSVRYNELSTQLVALQGELMAASSQSRQMQSSSLTNSPDVIANPLIQSLKAELTRAEIKMDQTAQRFEPAHPLYQSSKFEVERVRNELASQSHIIGKGIQSRENILVHRVESLQSDIAGLKARILERNRARDALAILARQVDSAQRNYAVTSERSAQADLESQSSQSDISLLNVAKTPIEPASPDIIINLGSALVLGLALGCVFAVLAEKRDHRIRSVFDLEMQANVPLLAVVTAANRPRRVSGTPGILRLSRSLK
jgi:succinoglycan biosynthesis transport protein ExoP